MSGTLKRKPIWIRSSGKFQAAGIKMIRLDAVGYAIKKPGTSCFMIPETFDFIAELTAKARALGIEVLVEIHSYYQKQIEIARQVDWVYDFALPPLVLHALFQRDPRPLARWLAISPRNAVTVLDTHDGIGVIDVGADSSGNPGLLAPAQIDNLVETIHQRSRGQSKQATGAAANNLDLYQVNCTFLDALGRPGNRVSDRPRPPVLRAGNSAGLLCRASGRRQRYGTPGPVGRRARHQPALLPARGNQSGPGTSFGAKATRADATAQRASRIRRQDGRWTSRPIIRSRSRGRSTNTG